MHRVALALALAASVLAPVAPAHGAPPACDGTLSGAVARRFACTVSVTPGPDGRTYLTIAPTAEVEDLPGFAPGSFDVTGVLRPGTWHLDDLGMGRASVAVRDGALFTATRTTGQRGEVTLTFTRVRKAKGGGWDVAGSYRARLLPVGAGREGEVVVEVAFGSRKG